MEETSRTLPPSEFRGLLGHPRLIALFEYWSRIRVDRVMPEWRDIRPEEIAAILPYIWAWQLDSVGEPRVRLVGENIASMIRVSTKGKSLFELYPEDYATELRAEFRDILDGPAGCHTMGKFRTEGVEGMEGSTGERLALPYGKADGSARGIIGVSYYPKMEMIYRSPTKFSRLSGPRHFLPLG
ncbi:MAG TPA: PAS domain-containing protein [Stellaceae bacterium]|nr:PAS domain-containing protein [Stellaceae bacterium]